MSEPKERLHTGHRSRMRNKFFDYGDKVFFSHELLEMFLYHIIPYKDTNPISKRLFARFGDLEGIFSADKESLMEVNGVGEKVADAIIALGNFSYFLKDAYKEKPIVFDDYSFTASYLVNLYSGVTEKTIYILLLNSRLELIKLHKLPCNVDFGSAAVRADAFIDAALANSASVAIIAHNHPHGPIFPGHGDIATTHMVNDALKAADVLLLEHFVVSGDSAVGFLNSIEHAVENLRMLAQTPYVDGFIKSKYREREVIE